MLIILNLSFLEFNILQDKNESALCPLSASEELFMDKINNGWVPFRFLLEIERKPNRYLKGIKIKKKSLFTDGPLASDFKGSIFGQNSIWENNKLSKISNKTLDKRLGIRWII